MSMNAEILGEFRELEEQLVALMDKARNDTRIDQRDLDLVRTNFEQGRMWFVKGVFNKDHSGWSRPAKPVEEERRFFDPQPFTTNLG